MGRLRTPAALPAKADRTHTRRHRTTATGREIPTATAVSQRVTVAELTQAAA